jgi:hypothetical protein
MNVIKEYLDNVFANLPNTEEVLRVKQDFYLNMEEKYYDLLEKGLTREEATNKVLMDFGDINELVEELEIENRKKETNSSKRLSKEKAIEYLQKKQKTGLMIAVGVFLIIMSVNAVIFFSNLAETGFLGFSSDSFGVIPMFLLIAVAVGLFIYAGHELEEYKYLKNGFVIDTSTRSYLEQQLQSFSKTHITFIIIGVILCILAPLTVIFSDIAGDSFFFSMFKGIPLIGINTSESGVLPMFTLISVAVFIFIYFGSIKDGYNLLLRKEEYSYINDKGEANKAVKLFDAIAWPIAVIIFFIAGFVFHAWHISWIIFPITGILQWMFNSVSSALE